MGDAKDGDEDDQLRRLLDRLYRGGKPVRLDAADIVGLYLIHTRLLIFGYQVLRMLHRTSSGNDVRDLETLLDSLDKRNDEWLNAISEKQGDER